MTALGIGLVLVVQACGDDRDPVTEPTGDAGAEGGDGGPTTSVVSLFEDRTPDETRTIDTLSARVDIARDELGIPHIYAANLADSAYALGYVHATDRLMQMDLFRHNVEGRLSEYFGEGLADTDVGLRTSMMTRDGRLVWDAIVDELEPELLELLQAYTAGINLVIAEIRSGDRPMPAGYDNALTGSLTPADIPDWTPADTIAVGRLQQQQLSESSGEDIARGNLLETLTPEMFADLARAQPADPTVILDEFYDLPEYQPLSAALPVPGGNPTELILDAKRRFAGLPFRSVLDLRVRDDVFGWDSLMPRDIRGSNNWVIDRGDHVR
jgi:acyl-homoserine lactone acylase PvdQ